MQMSTWDPDACHYEVLIDGEKVSFCAYANEEEGIALLYVTRPSVAYMNSLEGKKVQISCSIAVIDENEDKWLIERRGRVEIRWQDHHDKVFDPAREILTRPEGT